MSEETMAATIPGRVFYEAICAKAIEQSGTPMPFATWDDMPTWQQERMEAGAQAVLTAGWPNSAKTAAQLDDADQRIGELEAQLAELREQLDAICGDYDLLAIERDRVREVAREILAALGTAPKGISDPQLAEWRKRAGLGEAP